MEEAGVLAKNTSILMNVSEFDNVSEATDTLISALQAYKDEGSDVTNLSMQIIDAYNTVGNKFAISTSDLANSLTRSSAALVAANNDLAESIALTTAANTTIQDPEAVGNALKVVSMRIRGVKSELEAAGEDTEGMVENTAKLQEKIMALTSVDGGGGVDILTNTGEFKSTYEILLEISKVWDKISDTSQASLLETLAGKTRGSVVAGLLQNGDILESSYKEVQGSGGSAQEELQKYMDSIQGKTDQLTNSFQTMWNNALNSDFLKFLLDIANALVKITDFVGPLNIAFSALVGKKAFDINLGSEFKKASIGAETFGDALKNLGKSSEIAKLGTNLLTGALTGLASAAIGWALGKVFEWVDNWIHRAEILKEEVNELKDSFEDAKKTFESNIETLTTSGDTKLYATLEDEFASLTKGVDAYGNNIGLTADQYERYRKICETICDINPSLKAGYDDVTKAIGNNASALSNLIELQKIQARANAQEYVKDENIKSIAENAINIYNEAKRVYEGAKAEGLNYFDESSKIAETIKASMTHTLESGQSWDVDGYDIYTLLGFQDLYEATADADEGITDLIDEKYVEIFALFEEAASKNEGLTYQYAGSGATISMSADDVKIVKDQMEQYIYAYEEEVKLAEARLKEAQDGFIDSLLQVPSSMVAYEQLSDSDKSWITQWIKNSEIFKIDEDTTQDDILEAKTKIRTFVQNIADGDYTVSLDNGTIVSASDILDSIFNLDLSSIDWDEYKQDIQHLVDLLWQAIGAENNTLGFNDKNALALSIGFDIQTTDDQEQKMIQRYAEIKNITYEDAKRYFESLPAATVQRLLTVKWNLVDENNVDDTINGYHVNDVTPFNAYTSLSESIKSLNEAQQYANEVIHDGIVLSEDYYNALKEQLKDVTVNEEDFSDAVDENNGRIVKNAALLKKLINQSKNAQKATLNVAKAQAQLEYKNVVGQIRGAVSAMSAEYLAQGFVTNATLNNIEAMRDQLDILKQTIQQYSLLEIGLSEAANAYDEYEKAKQRDEELSYDNSFLEMLKTIDEGLLKNETGTEAFQYAVKAVLSPKAYADMEALDDVNEKVKFIHDYIDGDPIFSKLFYVDNESGELDINADNVREFANMGLTNGVFEGDDTGSFTLNKDIKGIEDVAKAYVISEAAALAMLSAMEKVDAKWGNILTDVMTAPLERDVNAQVDALDDTTKAYEDYWKAVTSGEKEYSSEEAAKLQANINEQAVALENAERVANENARSYTLCQAAISSYRGELSLTAEEANALARSLGFVDENGNPTITINDDGTLQLTDDQVGTILKKLGLLEEPAIMRVQLQYDTISSEIDQLKKYIDEGCQGTITINGVTFANGTSLDGSNTTVDSLLAELTAGKKQIEFTYGITETSSEKDKSILESYQELAKNGVSFTVTATVDNAKEGLDTVSEAQDKIKEEQKIEISINGANTVEQAIKNAADQLDRITSKVITLTVNVEKNETDNTTPSISGANVNTRPGHTMYALGNARATGSEGLKSAENNSIVGELGPELVCDPIKGKYYTVGDNGTEMVNLPRGAIIYNHKQTKELLENGHTSRGHYTGGLSFASGNAHSYYGIPDYHPNYEDSTSFSNGSSINYKWDDATSTLSDALNDASDSVGEFEETIDWIEIRMEELDEALSLYSANLENAPISVDKNNIIDQMIAVNEDIYSNAIAGAKYYQEYADKYLAGMNSQLVAAAKDGSIAIVEFTKEQDEATVNAIQKYREFAQKASDLTQKAVETITEIRGLAIQKIDNAQTTGDVKATVEDSQTEKLQNAVDLIEESGNIADDDYYLAMMENSNKKVEYLTAARKEMQKEFDDAVKSGALIKGSDEWYENLDKLYQIDSEIAGATKELEEFQNAINDIYWDNFDQLISRFDYVKEDMQGLIDLMDSADMVTNSEDRQYMSDGEKYWTADDVTWTDEGLATMGLYAQQMEVSEIKARQYAKAIDDLKADFDDGKYSENEYLEKLNELTSSQYDAIESYHDAQDAIKDLNSEMIDMVREGIEKQIDAYSELAEKRKEALDAEKEAYDWQKSISKQQKSISDIDRQLAAIAGNNSITATAKRKRLEAERAELQAELDDMYYERSIENQKKAIDTEVETFTKNKEEEIKKWDEYLENVEVLIADSLNLVQSNASSIYDTLSSKANEYDLTLHDALLTPWQDGSLAVSDYQEVFDTASSSTMDQLELINQKWQEIINTMNDAADASVKAMDAENNAYAAAEKQEIKPEKPKQPSTTKPSSSVKSVAVGSTINAGGATIYATSAGSGANTQYYGSDPIYVVIGENGGYWMVRHRSLSSGVTGWFKKSDVSAYAKGTTGTKKDELAWIDELGPELQLVPDGNGRLEYIRHGTAIIPHDISENLIQLGQLDPSIMLDQNRPVIGAPHVTNNSIQLSMDIAEVVHIDTVTNDTIPNLTKAIEKQMDKYMKGINAELRKYTR